MLPSRCPDPHEAFTAWFAEAVAREPDVPDAMQLATVEGGVPSLRTVLLKGHGPGGWVFYTNLGSQKGREITASPVVSGLLHWKSLERQVRVVGPVRRVADEEADAYFASRPRGSQIGAWASRQSELLDHPETLVQRVAAMEARFAGGAVPRPAFWGGFCVDVHTFEFWQGRRDRLHDRVRFVRDGEGWRRELLYP
jgi:pyridoxamine 5'-phosphate oxidase